MGVGTVYFTVRTSVVVLPALSVAVTVITLPSTERLILGIVQIVVPFAVPLPPLLLLHVTFFTPLVTSEATPAKANMLRVVL